MQISEDIDIDRENIKVVKKQKFTNRQSDLIKSKKVKVCCKSKDTFRQ